jgi:hypothetical protein
MNRSLDLGMMTNHRLLESTEESPEQSESTEHSSKPITPISYSPYKQGTNVLVYRVTTWIQNKVLVCYSNPDQIHARLNSSTQKIP